MRLEAPESFDLATTVSSHGWYQLAPFSYERESGGLSYVFKMPKSRPFRAEIRQENGGLAVSVAGRRGKAALEAASRGFERILSLDSDLAEFHSAVANDEALGWVAESSAGRLLRSPSVFEDLVKTICTTNCSWSLTKSMISNIVGKLGEPAPGGSRAFPQPEAMASADERFYREEIRAGYRSGYLLELAESVASGRIDPESWLDPGLTSEELRKKLLSIKGVGRYAAENMLKLLGHFDGLSLDSYLRSEFYKKHNRGKKCPDRRIERHYRKYGKWKGLAIWFDICGP